MSKRKLSKKEKYDRRIKEIEKASGRPVVSKALEMKGTESQKADVSMKNSSQYNLPLAEIKKDLWKNALYAVFSIGAVVALKVSGINFTTLFRHL